MEAEDRQALRRERKRQKDKKVRRIVWIVLAVLLAAIVILKLCEVDFGNLRGGSDTSSVLTGNFPYALDGSDGVTVHKQGAKLAVLTGGSITVLNPSDGKEEFTAVHGYANPITAASDSYLVTYDQGGSKLRLDYSGENLYEIESKTGLLCADVADDGKVSVADIFTNYGAFPGQWKVGDDGKVVYASQSADKRSDVQVITKTRADKMKYSLSYGFVTNIAIRDNGSQVAFVAMNSKDARLQPKLYLMRVKDTEPYASFDLPGTQVLDIAYRGSSLYVVGSSFVSVVNGDKLETVLKNGEVQTVAYDYSASGDLVVAYSSYSNATQNTVARITAGGKVQKPFTVQGAIKDLSASGSRVAVLFADKIKIYKLSDGSVVHTADCTDAVRSITMMSSNVFVQRQSVIEKEETKS